MKRILLALLFLGIATSAHAQYEPTFPGCATCGVIGYVDLPSNTSTVSNTALLAGWQAVEGWGFEKFSGNPVNRVDIYVEDDNVINQWHPVKEPDNTSAGITPRPDVEAAFVSLFPAIFERWTGFVRWINNPLPLGAHRFQFILWWGPYHNDNLHYPLIKTLNVVQ